MARRKTLDKIGETLGTEEDPGKLKQSPNAGKLQEGLERFTVIADTRTIDLIKDYARWTRRPIKDVVTEAFTDFLTKHDDEYQSPLKEDN